MKIRSAMKKLCEHCYIVVRGKKIMMKCKVDPRHKQRQGFSSIQSTTHTEGCTCCAPLPPMPETDLAINPDFLYSTSKIQADCMITSFPIADVLASMKINSQWVKGMKNRTNKRYNHTNTEVLRNFVRSFKFSFFFLQLQFILIIGARPNKQTNQQRKLNVRRKLILQNTSNLE